MNINRYFRLATLIATIALAFGLVNRVQAQSTNSITLLREALTTLAQADHDYKGHRVEAMIQIRLAIRELAGKNGIRGHPATRVQRFASIIRGKGSEPQANSDTQLRNAQNLLQQASSEVSGVVLQHVNTAIAQLNTALAIR
jgi:hypothetical protein